MLRRRFSSRELPPIAGADLRFVRGDAWPVHLAMREAASGRNLWIVGGGDLAGQFHDARLLDEIIVQVGSVTLGSGKPLFPRRLTSPPLELKAARRTGSGFAELTYRLTACGYARRLSERHWLVSHGAYPASTTRTVERSCDGSGRCGSRLAVPRSHPQIAPWQCRF